ncbi:MAG: outer membrane protein assembly factor BamD [Rikenellaceae bacterium]
MKTKQILLTLLPLLSIMMLSCSSYNELLKSGDTDAKYTEGMRLYHEKKYKRAIGLFENVYNDILGTPREDTLLFYIGKSLYNSGSFSTAGETFDTYRSRFTRSSFAEEAEFLYAMCYYRSVLSHERDQENTRMSIIAFNEYLNRYPESLQVPFIYEMIDELTLQLYQKTYMNAALYHKLGKYNAAITSLRFALKDQPDIPYKEEMMFLICKSWFDYAENSVFARQLDRYMSMIDAYYNFKGMYPESRQFDKELEDMFTRATIFTRQYGAQSQEVRSLEEAIIERRVNILNAKEEMFNVDTKEERQRLKKTIKHEREAMTEYKKTWKERKAVVKKEVKEIKRLSNEYSRTGEAEGITDGDGEVQ